MVDPVSGLDATGDLLVAGGLIQATGSGKIPQDTVVLDAAGCLLTPGFIDLHAHFREPGETAAESLESGAAAALRGGFTRVVTMPNTRPPVDTPGRVRAQSAGPRAPRVMPAACITRDRAGKVVADLAQLAKHGAVAFTDDGSTVADDEVMLEAMKTAASLKRTIMDHAVNPALAANGVIRDCRQARLLRLPLFPAAAESNAVARDIRLAEQAGCRLHIQHLSTGGAVEAICRARQQGLPVTGEVTPHHLSLPVDEIPGDNADFKINPPLATRKDIAALIKGLREKVITVLATDHAPHTQRQKNLGFRDAPFGAIGLETAAAVTYKVLVENAGFNLGDWVKLWTVGPAEVIGIKPPSFRQGSPAELALFGLSRPWTVRATDFLSKSSNCPFIGQTFNLRPLMTFCREQVFGSLDR